MTVQAQTETEMYHPDARRLLERERLNVGQIVQIRSGGDVGDGQGEEILWLTDEREPRCMVSRVKERVVSTSEGW